MKNTIEINNKKAYHDYFVDDTLECGIQLRGNEVKSIRSGACNIKESWCTIQDNNLVIRGMLITKYDAANTFDVDERRERHLLAHKREINKLADAIKTKGVTLIPLKLYFKNQHLKVLVGICRGKHNYDKRNTLKERQMQRDIERTIK